MSDEEAARFHARALASNRQYKSDKRIATMWFVLAGIVATLYVIAAIIDRSWEPLIELIVAPLLMSLAGFYARIIAHQRLELALSHQIIEGLVLITKSRVSKPEESK